MITAVASSRVAIRGDSALAEPTGANRILAELLLDREARTGGGELGFLFIRSFWYSVGTVISVDYVSYSKSISAVVNKSGPGTAITLSEAKNSRLEGVFR